MGGQVKITGDCKNEESRPENKHKLRVTQKSCILKLIQL